MKPAIYVVFSVTLSATQTTAQSCAPADMRPDPCLAGAWIGANTAMQRIQEMLASMPPSNATREVTMPDADAPLGILIYEDGFYHTLPLHRDTVIEDRYTDDTIVVDMDLTLATQAGWIWGNGTNMEFCGAAGSGGGFLSGTVESDGETGAFAVPVTGPQTFTPEISYSCSDSNLSFTVHLPAPIGEVDYYLARVPFSNFDEEFQELYDHRFHYDE